MKSMSGRRVLVVEDEPDLRVTLSEVLALHGYSVQSAANGREALRRLKAGPLPHLILLDLNMPIMDGWALRRELQKDGKLKGIPVVLLSGADDLADQSEHLQAKALQKPFAIGAVIDLVERVGRAISTYPPPATH